MPVTETTTMATTNSGMSQRPRRNALDGSDGVRWLVRAGMRGDSCSTSRQPPGRPIGLIGARAGCGAPTAPIVLVGVASARSGAQARVQQSAYRGARYRIR